MVVSPQGASVVKKLPANAGDTGDLGLIPGCGRSPGVGDGNPLQYFFFNFNCPLQYSYWDNLRD